LGTLIKILFSKTSGITAIILLSLFCIFTVFQTGKKEARAIGEKKLAEYQLKIAEKEISQLEKSNKKHLNQLADLNKTIDELKEKQKETEEHLAKAIKEYEFVVSENKEQYSRKVRNAKSA
jgi:peptidoglycan hydrolase CwlO-like protein